MSPDNASPEFAADEKLIQYLEMDMGFDLANVDLQNKINILKKRDMVFDNFEEFASAVASMIAVHETYFLRHHEQFDWIEKEWLPRLIENRGMGNNTTVRILSAGCATGEEPYSLYAHIYKLLERYGVGLEIDAVDISEKSLETARKGWYGLWSLRGISINEESEWLDVKSRLVTVKSWVKEGVNFFKHNLTRPFNVDKFAYYDLVLCRNVMIYMHNEAIKRTYENLANVVKENGYIIPGPSDPSVPETCELNLVWSSGVRLYQKCAKNHQSETVSNNCRRSAILPLKKVIPSGISTYQQQGKNVKEKITTDNTNAEFSSYTKIQELIRDCQYTAARELLEKNIAIDALDTRSHIMLAVLALDLDDKKLAAVTARKAQFLEPESIYAAYIMANYKKRIGDEKGERNRLSWIKNMIEKIDEQLPVVFCEDITVGELKAVVAARLS